jgi:hypothetical protein
MPMSVLFNAKILQETKSSSTSNNGGRKYYQANKWLQNKVAKCIVFVIKTMHGKRKS